MKRPNFLWITLEDCSPRFGCYGDKIAQTPNIDRLAAEGTLYPETFCTAPVCSPSRTSVITGVPSTSMLGLHMRTTYTAEEFPGLPTPYHAVPAPHVKCITEYLRTAGYYCTNNGKTDYQFESPFCAWDENGKPRTVDEIHWRNRSDTEQPFFAVFNLEDTHERRMWEGSFPELEADARPVPGTDSAQVAVPPFLPDTPEVRAAIARQYDFIAHNDAIVGKLLAQLEADGLTDDTIVMLWADHGEGLPRAKRFLYDSGVRVPLVVRWPGRFAAGVTDQRLVSLLDLAPTMLELAGAKPPEHMQGRSVAPVLRGEAAPSPDARAFIESEWHGIAIRTASHLVTIPWREKRVVADAPSSVFDLRADPFELNNLAGHEDDEARALTNELRIWNSNTQWMSAK